MSASFKWYRTGRHGKYAGIFYRIADISLGGIRIIIRKFPKNRCFHKYIPVIFCPLYSSAVSSIDVQGDNTVPLYTDAYVSKCSVKKPFDRLVYERIFLTVVLCRLTSEQEEYAIS